jgi:hypothetical protein
VGGAKQRAARVVDLQDPEGAPQVPGDRDIRVGEDRVQLDPSQLARQLRRELVGVAADVGDEVVVGVGGGLRGRAHGQRQDRDGEHTRGPQGLMVGRHGGTPSEKS